MNWKFDPAPFIDDDGQAYLYFGGGPASTSMPPAENINNPKNHASDQARRRHGLDQGHGGGGRRAARLRGGPRLQARRQVLLLVLVELRLRRRDRRRCRLPGGGQIGYLISDNPMVVDRRDLRRCDLPQPSQFFGAGTGGNNHQSVFEFDGRVLLHLPRPDAEQRITGGATQGFRSPHMPGADFNPDGTIKQVSAPTTASRQVRDFDPYRVIEAETFAWSKGIATTKIDGGFGRVRRAAPNLVVHDIDNGDWTALVVGGLR